MNWPLFHYRLTFASLLVLSVGIFSGVAIASISHILIFLPGIYFSLKNVFNIKFKEIPMSVHFMGLICLSIIISVISNWNDMQEPYKNLFKIKYFLLAIFSIFAYKEAFNNYLDRRKKSLLIHVFVLSTTVATISGLIGLFTGFNPLKMKEACHVSRACGLYGMYMTYGYGMALFMILLTGIILYRDKFQQYINIKILSCAWAVNCLGLYFSFTRGGWLSFLFTVPFFFFKENKIRFIYTIGIGFLLLTIILSLSSSTRKMFLARGSSNSERIAFFQTALKAFQEKPLFGWGYRNLEPNILKIKKRYNINFLGFPNKTGHAHNNFLEHLATTGIIGFTAFFFWHLYWALESFRRKDIISSLSVPFVMCFFIGGLTQYTFGDSENLFLILNIWVLGQIRYL